MYTRACTPPNCDHNHTAVGDNIGGGSAADSTFILAEAIHQGISSYLQSMFDPAAALTCEAAGVGATVRFACKIMARSAFDKTRLREI